MEYKIPLFKLNFDDQEVDAVVETIRSKWISTGPKCEELENTFAEMLSVKHAVSLEFGENRLFHCGIYMLILL